MHKLPQPVKLWTWGPFFRHEAPQAGRFRQFTQLNVEALGSDDPSIDAELILLLCELVERSGAGPARVRISSLGTPETRADYVDELRAYLRAREDELSDEVRARLDQNPLRAFDADHEGTRAVMAAAPRLLDRLDPDDAAHFAEVRALLDAAGLEYELDSALVRGLDYYTRTVFELESPRLGAQAALGGGGRYDRLIEQLGGPPTPGVGWAAGIERILLASELEPATPRSASTSRWRSRTPSRRRSRWPSGCEIEGIRVEIEQAGRSMKGQLKQADRIGARTTVILGDAIDVKDMASGEQREAADADEAVALVREALDLRPPRPNEYRDHWAGELRADDVGEELLVAGWVHRRRDHGGLIFIDLRDRTGLLQLVFRPEEAPEAHAAAGGLRGEDVISAKGKLVRRDESAVNPDLPTGEVELVVSELDKLADAETPPFQIDEDDPVGEELRLRYRYLDLRKEAMRDRMILRHDVVKEIRDSLSEEGFLEIETPIMTRSTPEGARDFLVPSRLVRGSWYALPQSPQLFKQLLMMGGMERYFQIARCFRDEDFRADRQPEFTQLDVEMAFVEEEDVHDTVDRLLQRVLAVGGIEVSLPIERMTYDDALLRYGSDRPDRRLGVEIEDLSDVFGGSEFKVFAGAVESGGVVRAIKAGGEWPRSRFDALTEQAQSLGAKGLAWAVVEEDGGWRSPIAKFLSDDEIRAATERLGATPGEAVLIVADAAAVAAKVLGALRPRWREAQPQGHDLFWVVDFPMFEWNEDEGRFDALHHPFTSPDRRPRRRPGNLAQPRLRRRAGRLGARRRLDPNLDARGPAEGLRCARHRARRRRASASDSCSRRSPTARRRTAGSPSGSTAWWRCSPALRRSAT